MEVNVTEHYNHVTVVSTHDRVDSFTAPTLREALLELLGSGITRLVVDLSNVPFLDSAGMAVLVSALKRARQAGGDVKLVWPRAEMPRHILRLTRFDRVFDFADSPQAAAASF